MAVDRQGRLHLLHTVPQATFALAYERYRSEAVEAALVISSNAVGGRLATDHAGRAHVLYSPRDQAQAGPYPVAYARIDGSAVDVLFVSNDRSSTYDIVVQGDDVYAAWLVAKMSGVIETVFSTLGTGGWKSELVDQRTSTSAPTALVVLADAVGPHVATLTVDAGLLVYSPADPTASPRLWLSSLVLGGKTQVWEDRPAQFIRLDEVGQLHAVWYGGAVFYARRAASDAAAAWLGDPQTDFLPTEAYPAIGIDQHGQVHLLANAKDDGKLLWRTRQGAAWSPSTVLADDGIPASHMMAIDSADALHLVYGRQGGGIAYRRICMQPGR